jgi:hypothetical protein
MERTGALSIANGESRIDGTLLARCDESDPIGAATAFLLNRGFQSGDFIQVSGDDGTIGGVAVFCMDDAQGAAAPLGIRAAKKATKAARKAAKKVKKKSAKNGVKKKAKPQKKGTSNRPAGESRRRS